MPRALWRERVEIGSNLPTIILAKDRKSSEPWSLEIPWESLKMRFPGLKSIRILRDPFWNWVKSATDDIGQSILQDPHWKLPSTNSNISNRKFSQTPTCYEICFTSNNCNIYCVQLAYQGFNQTRRIFRTLDHNSSRFSIIVWGAFFSRRFVTFVIRKSRRPYPWDSLQHYQLEVSLCLKWPTCGKNLIKIRTIFFSKKGY